ncbi:MAG TPA: small ribosomal subunit Rsm22 family protein [Nitrospira sp.]|nr:small ribosomal subunit Rsm22 family protein [Nitrospira sp.]
MRTLNATVSPLLLDAIDQLVEKEGLSHERLARAVTKLSRLFTKERAELRRSYLEDPTSAAAYLKYFLPVNLSKIQVLLDEMPEDTFGKNQRFAVLDLGSGPGTGGLAVLDWSHQHSKDMADALSVVAVDISPATLRCAESLWKSYCRAAGITSATLQSREADLERALSGPFRGQIQQAGPYDIIILANCLNELSESIDTRTSLIATALSLLSPHGTMMIVEPALRETSRALHRVRDRLLQEKRCTVYSPCLHERNCPALINPDDWCHEERAWDPPAAIRQIDENVGFIKDALKFSYLLLRKDGKTIVDRRPDMYRVVSELREFKGEKRAWLCNEQGRQEVGRQDRLTSPQNVAFDRWHRGAIVQIEKIVRKERGGKVSSLGRIERDATVRIIRPV